uniref:Uncharacterized protein n=1 Tax=Panagrolaimus sp. JU765 TaxID=591449 RepID=A0AC34QI51_9BILA
MAMAVVKIPIVDNESLKDNIGKIVSTSQLFRVCPVCRKKPSNASSTMRPRNLAILIRLFKMEFELGKKMQQHHIKYLHEAFFYLSKKRHGLSNDHRHTKIF